jgi:hypothetical protein
VLGAIGGGLIAVGAVLLLSTVWWPPSPAGIVGTGESERQQRNTEAATLASAVLTFSGAALLLYGSSWLWALVGMGAAAGFYYVLLAWWTHTEWSHVEQQVRRERGLLDGRITIQTADRMRLRIQPPGSAQGVGTDIPLPIGDEGLGAHAQEIATTRARLLWALANPRGIGAEDRTRSRREALVDELRALDRFVRRQPR